VRRRGHPPGRVRAHRARRRGFFIAYGLTLAALKEAPAAAVAAVRETSVVIAVAWLALNGRERATGWRAGGAVTVACGVAPISAAGAA
jgi:drug/metabolite transporter (DMT)-like permease